MDEKLIRKAIEDKLNKQELYVLMACKIGVTEVYDIQVLTGFRKVDVIRVLEKISGYYITDNNIYTIRSTGKNFQTPPFQIASYLYSILKRMSSPSIKELVGIKAAYLQAYKHCSNNQQDAIQLVKDCIEVNVDNLKHATYPGLYLKRLFDSYLSSLPEIPWEIRENAKLLRRRLRYDPKLRQYTLGEMLT